MSCTVRVASPLRSYTGGAAVVPATGSSVAAVLADLDLRFPGMRFRMIDEQGAVRPHIRIFIGTREVRDLATNVEEANILHLICALSGG